mmetsp:Transcript_27825/g.68423  ORF Transcript_27825/g.68423 Transcript_27825/m.68423 type:complete len:661 (+) Transcript_27825:1474-3456(+)
MMLNVDQISLLSRARSSPPRLLCPDSMTTRTRTVVQYSTHAQYDLLVHAVAPVAVQAGREVVLQLHHGDGPGGDGLGVEDVQPRLVLPRVVDHHQHPAVVLVRAPGPGREDGLLHERPLPEVVHLLAGARAHLGLGVELDQALVGPPLDVVLDGGAGAVHVAVLAPRALVVHGGELHHAVAEGRLRHRAARRVDVEARVLHASASVVERRGDHVQVHAEVHEHPRRGVEHHARGVLAVRGLEGVDVVEEELAGHGDGALPDLARLVGAGQHVQDGALAVHHADHLRQRALGEDVLRQQLLGVQRRGVLQQHVPVLGDQAVVEEPERGVLHPKHVARRAPARRVPLVEAALVGRHERRLRLDAERHQPLLRRVLGVPHAVVRRHLRHLQRLPQHGVRLAHRAQRGGVHLVRLAPLPQRVQLARPVYDAGVGHVLHVEVERVVERVALGVADGEGALVQHLARRLLVREALGAHEVVLERQRAVLERDGVHQPVPVEELVQLLAEDLQQPRAVAEQRAAELLGDGAGDARRRDGARRAAVRGAQAGVAVDGAPVLDGLSAGAPAAVGRRGASRQRRARQLPFRTTRDSIAAGSGGGGWGVGDDCADEDTDTAAARGGGCDGGGGALGRVGATDAGRPAGHEAGGGGTRSGSKYRRRRHFSSC